MVRGVLDLRPLQRLAVFFFQESFEVGRRIEVAEGDDERVARELRERRGVRRFRGTVEDQKKTRFSRASRIAAGASSGRPKRKP